MQMPKIWWNAQIQSHRSLLNLEKIKLVGYKQGNQPQPEQNLNQQDNLVRIQLEFREEPRFGNYTLPED